MVDSSLEKLKQKKDVLKLLGECKSKIRKAILKNAEKDLIETICHCIYNLLKGNINLTQSEKQKLSKYKHVLRQLVQKSSVKEKKKILIQKGGFLEFLIPAAITGISSIISSVISSNTQ